MNTLQLIAGNAFFGDGSDAAGGMVILMLIASIAGFVLAIVWLVFPFLVLSRLKEIAALQRTQAELAEQISTQLQSIDTKAGNVCANTYASAENSATALKMQTQDQTQQP